MVNYYIGAHSLLDAGCSSSSNGGYVVETTRSFAANTNSQSSTWQIKFSDPSKIEGDIIRDGDMVHIVSKFGATPSFLDANGVARCSTLYGATNIFEVETTPNLQRDETYKSSTWQIVLKDVPGGKNNFHARAGLL